MLAGVKRLCLLSLPSPRASSMSNLGYKRFLSDLCVIMRCKNLFIVGKALHTDTKRNRTIYMIKILLCTKSQHLYRIHFILIISPNFFWGNLKKLMEDKLSCLLFPPSLHTVSNIDYKRLSRDVRRHVRSHITQSRCFFFPDKTLDVY